VTFSKAISRFAAAAQDFCAWIEGAPGDAAQEHQSATRLTAELFAAALFLPDSEPAEVDAPSLGEEQRNRVGERLRSFPFQYYWEIFHPITETPEEPVCGDIADDLGDIYFDVKAGLLVYPTSVQAAIWQWRMTFGFHWGKHATSALRALYAFDPHDEREI
jgi:hypothetical protein